MVEIATYMHIAVRPNAPARIKVTVDTEQDEQVCAWIFSAQKSNVRKKSTMQYQRIEGGA